MRKTLSPYYIDIPLVSPNSSNTCSKYTLNIRVWDGLQASAPTAVTYAKTVVNSSVSTGTHEINISRLINDFIDLTPQTNLATGIVDGNNQQWVQTSVIYVDTNNAIEVEQSYLTELIVKGYAYGNEGRNTSTPATKLLIDGTEFNISRAGMLTIPIEVSNLTSTVISYPDNEINFSQVLTSTTDSAESVKYIYVNGADTTTDTYIEVIYNGTTITLNVVDECKYTPIDVIFFNKNGSQQTLPFFKDKTDSLKVKKETYESDRGQPSAGNHQFIDFNVQARSSFKVHSGFVDEDMNETFRQLLLSSRIWMYDGTNMTPLNIKTTSFNDKTRQRERLISYEIEFELSYNEINNI